jgi:rfaE bifunctional protein kinase chain/domain
MTSEKIVLVSGHFNVLHPGHLRLLRFARTCGTKLVVAVFSDRVAGKAAHVPQKLRLEGVQSNSLVDEAFIADQPIDEVIRQLRPQVVVKGKEHEATLNTELAVLESYGGRLVFSSGESIFSSVDLIKKEFEKDSSIQIKLPNDFLGRHEIRKDDLLRVLYGFSNLRVAVIGDLIVDEYITCQPLGMSQEDPTIVVTPLDSTKFIGGAGIVAAHAAGLGATVDFISISGQDPSRIFAVECLEKYRVKPTVLVDDSRPTTLKQRYRSQGKSLLRVSHLHEAAISSKLQDRIVTHFEEVASQTNLLVLSDFNYGCLPNALVSRLLSIASAKGIYVAADSQSSSQVGDIARFRGVNLITPTEREARISMRNREDGLVILAEALRHQAEVDNVLLKLGGEGLLVHAKDDKSGQLMTDRIEALNAKPQDVAGAGDSLLIASAMTLAFGGSIWEAACLGSIAAAVQVGRMGNVPLSTPELADAIQR